MSDEFKSKNVFSISERDVYSFYGSTVAGEGNSYQRSGRVLSAKFVRPGKILLGEVQGSNISPYSVEIRLTSDVSSIKSSACSCRLGGMCKHGAALALDVLRGERLSHSDLKIALSLPEQEKGLFYVLDIALGPQRLILNVVHATKLSSGEWGRSQNADLNRITLQSASYIAEEDCRIAKAFLAATRTSGWLYRNTIPEVPEVSRAILQSVIATGRCFWKELGSTPLRLGAEKDGILKWETQPDGRQALRLSSSSSSDLTVIAGFAWYINLKEHVFGPLTLKASPQALKNVVNAGPMDTLDAVAASKILSKADLSIPEARTNVSVKTVDLTPKAKLRLVLEESIENNKNEYSNKTGKAFVSFDYGSGRFEQTEASEIREVENNNIVIYKRDLNCEATRMKQLEQNGLRSLPKTEGQNCFAVCALNEATETDWLMFRIKNVLGLQELGWEITFDQSFNLQIVKAEEQWSLDLAEGTDFWFSLDLGITVNGQKLSLLPILARVLELIADRDPLDYLSKLNHEGVFYAPLSDGRHIALPFDRVQRIVQSFKELFGRSIGSKKSVDRLSLPEFLEMAGKIESVIESEDGFTVSKQLQRALEKVKLFRGLEKIAVAPPNFAAQLRPYQLDGLSWLNFLREFELGGVLADDMGLGKTVQTLAHVSLEKSEKRLAKPFLVVCPTSVLPNWISEIEKFTPALRATALYGPDRAKDFARIAESDLVLTTYPLVIRDADTLLAQSWKAVVLDEAQMIKNPNTQIAQTICKLQCDYRICLTGTPIENHLGELWSQFNFLMPGFLHDLASFTKNFRTPIEKNNDKEARLILADRVRPFLLRRTKELVAKELPEKSIIIKRIELEGAQRDLYETVRLAVFEKVQDSLITKGLERSNITILDALLKLRQVCCDPRLVSMASARNVQSSAKLDYLLSMLEELHAEGKRILLFSQFTSMLDLVIPELKKREIDFVEIRGSTKDRTTPVQRFQKGSVPVFLLSLKSGGFGLNLTAADTVIHYDPWWNPAVEKQATDRAHRIGQSKSVFVFKLIASKTIEDRMLELQERKTAIAESVFDEENSLPSKLSSEDLVSLFGPL